MLCHSISLSLSLTLFFFRSFGTSISLASIINTALVYAFFSQFQIFGHFFRFISFIHHKKKINNNFIAKTQFKITNIFFFLFLRALNTYLFECVDMNISIQIKINNQTNEIINCVVFAIKSRNNNQTNNNHCTNAVQSCVNVYPSNRHTFTNTKK